MAKITGGAISDAQILRIVDVRTGSDLYRHGLYHTPEMEIRPVNDELPLKHDVWVKGADGVFVVHAGFNTFGDAAHWVAFMCGNCFNQPM